MTTTDINADISTSASPNRTGVYLAVLQLVFTLGWTTYVIYLPKLAAQVGIAPTAVILILMLDQAVFTISDTAMGMAADRITGLFGRIGLFVGVLTAISCAAFVALPFVAGTGSGAPVWFIVLILIWAVTSSALRAPPLTLLAKHHARPKVPFLAALAMLGYGLAGALSPYLGVVLRDRDPRLPFLISGVVLLITTLALSKVERGAARDAATPEPATPAKPLGRMPIVFIASMVILSLGSQLHFSINSAPFFLRFAKPDQLQWLLPVFWIGFNIAMFPASSVVKHRRERRRRQAGGAGIFSAGAGDICADGCGGRRHAEIAGIRAAVAMGAGGVLVGRRCRAAGDRSIPGAAEVAGARLVVLSVIPGRCAASNPESRDSGFATRPGMTGYYGFAG